MKSPFLSPSIRDFWSNRWNQVIKEMLHRLAFKPTLSLIDQLSPKQKKNVKRPEWHYMLAVMSSFILSAAIHEWMVFIYMDGPSTL